MLDRLYLPLLAVAAVAVVALGMVWPQGLGDRSPAPFGHQPIQRTPEMQARMQRQHEASMRRAEQERAALRTIQNQAVDVTQ
jgi:hypothetical protein